MHQTKVTREMVYRAVMARERQCSIPSPALELSHTDPDAFIAQSKEWQEREEEATLVTLRLFADIINTLADEMGIDIAAIRGNK